MFWKRKRARRLALCAISEDCKVQVWHKADGSPHVEAEMDGNMLTIRVKVTGGALESVSVGAGAKFDISDNRDPDDPLAEKYRHLLPDITGNSG